MTRDRYLKADICMVLKKRLSQKPVTYGSNYIKKLKTTYSHAGLDPASMQSPALTMDSRVRPVK